MSFVSQVKANRVLASTAVAAGLAALMLGGLPASAQTPDGESQTAIADTELSARERRREERRQRREERNSDEAEAAETSVVAYVEATGITADEIIVVVEPEIECRRVSVTGSKMRREVCFAVAQQAANAEHDEERAQDFLRRQAEQAQIARPVENPASVMPGF